MVNKNWLIESTATTINANIKLGWKASAELNGFNRNNAYVSHYSSSLWDVISAGTATASANNTFELSRMGLTSLSPFAVVENGELLKVAEISKTEEGTSLYPNPAKDVLYIKLMNVSANYSYELTDISGRIISTSTVVMNNTSFNVSNLEKGSYFLKVINLTENKTTTKRFIKD